MEQPTALGVAQPGVEVVRERQGDAAGREVVVGLEEVRERLAPDALPILGHGGGHPVQRAVDWAVGAAESVGPGVQGTEGQG